MNMTMMMMLTKMLLTKMFLPASIVNNIQHVKKVSSIWFLCYRVVRILCPLSNNEDDRVREKEHVVGLLQVYCNIYRG